MKTEQWLDLLASDATPVDTRAHEKRLLATGLVGTTAAALWAGSAWGWRSFTPNDLALPMLWARWLFCAGAVAAAAVAVTRLARPGSRLQGLGAIAALPFAGIALLALVQWMSADPGERHELLWGQTALQCPGNIALVSLPVWLLSLWTMRRMAPTRPMASGAASGLLAGAAGALGYTFHCTELAAPFIAVWYVLGIGIPTVAGALAGRWLLRW